MKLKFLCLLMGILLANIINAQSISGVVYEKISEEDSPLPGVNVYWLGTQSGVTTDMNGKFKLKRINGFNKLVLSYIGYKTDTILVKNTTSIKHIMQQGQELNEIVITQKAKGSHMSKTAPMLQQNITGAELCKAACCNLAESFETNASVDVAYSDAVSGAKQIQLLGLAGTYSQLMTENMPSMRGLSAPFGLGYVPGSWMSAIQVSKGAASVINGYESITGQINTEFKKPDGKEKFFFNFFASDGGKYEANSNASLIFNKKWSTMLLVHAEDNNLKHDKNDDGFVDMPLIEQYNFFNRWKYKGENIKAQFGIKVIDEKRNGGQTDYDFDQNRGSTYNKEKFGTSIETTNIDAFTKLAYVFNDDNNTSIALVSSYNRFEQESFYGLNTYTGKQNSMYQNLIMQTELGSEDHKLSAGLSYVYDDYDENLIQGLHSNNEIDLQRTEKVPGAFAQYTFHKDNFTMLAGMRVDNHNTYGTFITPRLHLKYNLTENTSIRSSVGKGYRSTNVLSENSSLLASSRFINGNNIKNLDQEEAWNYGLSASHSAELFGRPITVVADYFKTDFVSQTVVDLETNPAEALIYNLDGDSYANNYQLEINYEPIKNLDLTLAYRVSDVKTTMNKELIRKPLTNRYKGLINLSYLTNLKKWQIDYTVQFNGNGTLPKTQYIVDNNLPTTYDSFVLMNTQVTKYFKNWSVYVGCENITNFTQKNPIASADNWKSTQFDASSIWGPIKGRKLYFGLRFSIESL